MLRARICTTSTLPAPATPTLPAPATVPPSMASSTTTHLRGTVTQKVDRAKSGPPVYFSLQKAVHLSEKWTGCSFRSLVRLCGCKNITNETFMTVFALPKVDQVQFSLCQKWIRSSFCSAKSGPGPVFARPKVDPVQFLLGQKWTRSSFHFAKSEPVQVFVQPRVDLVRVEFCGTKVGSTYRSLFSDYDIKLCVYSLNTADEPLAAIYSSVLFEHYHPRYMPLSVYSHWHTHAVAIRIPV